MNILRSERLILVEPVSAPLTGDPFARSNRRLVNCPPASAAQAAAAAWRDGFFPLLVFQQADAIERWTHDIPLLSRRWAAFALDREPDRLDWLLHHPALEVLRGLAHRDMLALPDAEFDQGLREWVARDPEARGLLEQLREGRLEPAELEPIPTPPPASPTEALWNERFAARWRLDPRVTLALVFDRSNGDVWVTAEAQDALPPQSLGGPGRSIPFDEAGRVRLHTQDDEDRIRALAQSLDLPAELQVWGDGRRAEREEATPTKTQSAAGWAERQEAGWRWLEAIPAGIEQLAAAFNPPSALAGGYRQSPRGERTMSTGATKPSKPTTPKPQVPWVPVDLRVEDETAGVYRLVLMHLREPPAETPAVTLFVGDTEIALDDVDYATPPMLHLVFRTEVSPLDMTCRLGVPESGENSIEIHLSNAED